VPVQVRPRAPSTNRKLLRSPQSPAIAGLFVFHKQFLID